MEQTNLAAAILRCVVSGPVEGRLGESERLTNEDAINLADWLQSKSSISAWRNIYLTQAHHCLRDGIQIHHAAAQ
jgi:hypothetical protein